MFARDALDPAAAISIYDVRLANVARGALRTGCGAYRVTTFINRLGIIGSMGLRGSEDI